MAQRDLLRDLREWLQEFTGKRVDGEASVSSSEALGPSEPRRPDPLPRVGSGKHNAFTHVPKDRNHEVCRRTNFTRVPCRKRTSGHILCVEKLGHLLTVDEKVHNEEWESRNRHRYAVLVQDLDTQWSQASTCKTKISQKPAKTIQKFLELKASPKVICTDHFFGVWQSV